MTTVFSGTDVAYRNDGTISDGALIDGTNITLTNGDSGRIIGGLTFAQGGHGFVNELGGIVRVADTADPFATDAISGSSGNDLVTNAGAIYGLVHLGDGNDTFVYRDGTSYGVNLGSGDDIYRFEGSGYGSLVEGGAGRDRIVIANYSQASADRFSGFEDVTFSGGGNLQFFSGYQSITFAGPGDYNLVSSSNPTVDVSLDGQSLRLSGSSLASVSGGDGSETVEVAAGGHINGAVTLGGGDDSVAIADAGGEPGSIAGSIDGGAGADQLNLFWYRSGDRSYDLANASGFETLSVNGNQDVGATFTRVTHAQGFDQIWVGSHRALTLGNSNLPSATVSGAFGGAITIEAGTTIARYGAPLDGPFDRRTDIQQGDDRLSLKLVNSGEIKGEVVFYVGDDTYDGSAGAVGGPIYGNAGNDILIGGAGAEQMYGGYGADILTGGLGADTLTGGAGADMFRDTAAGLNGDTIADFGAGDRIRITDASLANFSFALSGSTLTYSGGSVTLSGLTGARLEAAAVAGGGVDLIYAGHVVRNDFNGDGHADVLWRNDNGGLTDWLGHADGSFTANDRAAFASVLPSWKVADVADINGDGRADILWRNDSGAITDWLGHARRQLRRERPRRL